MNNSEIRYQSAQTSSRLESAQKAITTVVEAPVGYGKTYVVQEWLRKQKDANVIYFTAVSNLPYGNYAQLCKDIRIIDPDAGNRLIEIGAPDSQNIEEIASIITDIKCQKETYLVLDSFQYFQKAIPPQIVFAMLWHSSPDLHIIIITQHLKRLTHHLLEWDSINLIDKESLSFKKRDIIGYAHNVGIDIDDIQLQAIYDLTEGCPAMVSMFFENMLQGRTEISSEIAESFLPSVFFDRLSEWEKEIMLRLSVTDRFGKPFIRHMVNDPDLLYDAFELIERVPLITYLKQDNTYVMNPVLSNFLNHSRHRAPLPIRERIHKLASSWYLRNGDAEKALYHSYRIEDYETILQESITNLSLPEMICKVPLVEIISQIVSNCSKEIKVKYPNSLLRCAYYLYRAGKFSAFDSLMAEIRNYPELAANEAFIRDWKIIYSYSTLSNLKETRRIYLDPSMAVRANTGVVQNSDPFLFNSPSIAFLCYTTPGKGDDFAADLNEIQPVYTSLTEGHGSGADILYAGELAYLRCQFDEAEILAYKAAYIASGAGQKSLSLGASFLLGRVAYATGNKNRLDQVIQHICSEKTETGFEDLIIRILRSEIDASDLDELRRESGLTCIYAKYLSCMILLCRQEFKQAIGEMEAMLLLDSRICTPLVKIYIYIGLAISYLGIDRTAKAIENIDKALTLAGPDKLTAPFVRFYSLLHPVLEHKTLMQKYCDLLECIRQTADANSTDIMLPSQIMPGTTTPKDLTERELEIATLVAKGLRNKEIALTLNITEGTVKNHLKNIFQKMNIDRRSDLIRLIPSER